MWTLTGFVYVAFIVDVFSRRILGWRVATSKQTPLVTDVLHQALTTRQVSETGWDAAGLIHHSDSKYVRCQVFPGFVTLTPIDPRAYRGVGGVLAAS